MKDHEHQEIQCKCQSEKKRESDDGLLINEKFSLSAQKSAYQDKRAIFNLPNSK